MTPDEIQKLLDEASGLYNDGAYDAAIAIWNRILAADPENERAREGIKMVELLTTEWQVSQPAGPQAAAAAPAAGGEVAARVREGVQRVEDLFAAGDHEAARDGVEALQQVAPDDPAVILCAARVEGAGNEANYIEEQLAMARHFMILGETDAANRACRKVLSLHPDHSAAREMLGSAAGLDAPSIPLAAAPEAPLDLGLEAMEGGEPLALSLDEAAAGTPPAMEAAAAAMGEARPAAAPPPPEARIAALLAEGDRLRDEGRLDQAIDAWSRVFVIQDNHPEAERRVDAARRALEEQGRQIEAHLYRGEDLLGGGHLEEAREAFLAVLALRPTHAEAKARLEDIDRKLAGGTPEAVPLQGPVPAAPRPAAPRPAPPPIADVAPLPTPPPAPQRRRPVPPPPKVRRKGAGTRALLAALGLLGAAGGGWYAWQRFFPPAVPPAAGAVRDPAAGGASGAPQPAAPPETAAGESAAGPAAAAPPPPAPALTPEQARARSQDLARAGQALFQSRSFGAAAEKFREALQVEPANFEAQDWLAKAEKEVARREQFERDLASVRQAFDDRDYHAALYKLYRIEPLDDAGRQTIQSWIGTCWFDWGVALLQARNPREAEEKFQEALAVRAGDTQASQHLDVARRYRSRAVDGSYEAYVNRLTLRPLD